VRFQARNKPKVEAIRTMILGPTMTEARTTLIEQSSSPVMASVHAPTP
jgi:hypothetical protein